MTMLMIYIRRYNYFINVIEFITFINFFQFYEGKWTMTKNNHPIFKISLHEYTYIYHHFWLK